MLSLFLFVLTAGIVAVQGQASFILRGQILAAASKASEHVEVVLEKSPDRVIAKTLSDGTGNFEFRNLDVGKYEVVVRVEGYDEAREIVEIGGNGLDVAQLAQATADGQEQPPPALQSPDVVGGTTNVYIVVHKRNSVAAGSAESDPEFAVVTELSRKYPKRVLQEYERAVEYNRRGDPARAAERYEAVVKLAPDFYYGHNSLGIVYQKMDRYRDAEREYNLARKLNPQSDQPLLNLGKLFMQEADASTDKGPILVGRILDQALDVLEEATKNAPGSAMAHFLLAAAYHKSDFDEEAETNLKRALEIDGSMGVARLLLANVYMRQENWGDALKLLDAYLAQNPNALDRSQIEGIRSKVEQNLKPVPK